jgi:hypothetical protein
MPDALYTSLHRSIVRETYRVPKLWLSSNGNGYDDNVGSRTTSIQLVDNQRLGYFPLSYHEEAQRV